MFGREELVTPEIAKMYLQKSAGNRSLSRAKVEQYKADIIAGKWQLNSDGIAFSKNGVLKNGHHRLTAIVEAGVPATMWIVYDVPNETTAYDIGKSRSMTQYLKVNEGLPPLLANNNVAAIVRLHKEYSLGISAAAKLPMAETAKFIREYADDLYKTNRICTIIVSKRSLLRRASIGYSVFCAMKCGVPEEELRKFAQVVSSGIYDDIRQCAAVVVRNYLLIGSPSNIRHSDSISRIRETRVIQTGLSDFLSGTPRKRSYDESKCIAIYSERFIKSQKKGESANETV